MSMPARTFLSLIACASIAMAQSSPKPSPKMTTKLTPEAVHRSALVIDTHADTPQRFLDENYDLGQPLNGGNLNLESARKGNLGAEFFSIWVEPTINQGHYAKKTLELIDSVKQQVAKHPDRTMFVATPEGIEFAHRQHKLAALMGIEGGHSIENSLALLRQYYALGVRYMTLTWSNSTDWADSSGDIEDPKIPHTKEGLSEFGKDVVYEMNKLGMMVDISHVSDRTFFRTLIITRAPVSQLGRTRIKGRRGTGELLLRIYFAGISRRPESAEAGGRQGGSGIQGQGEGGSRELVQPPAMALTSIPTMPSRA